MREPPRHRVSVALAVVRRGHVPPTRQIEMALHNRWALRVVGGGATLAIVAAAAVAYLHSHVAHAHSSGSSDRPVCVAVPNTVTRPLNRGNLLQDESWKYASRRHPGEERPARRVHRAGHRQPGR